VRSQNFLQTGRSPELLGAALLLAMYGCATDRFQILSSGPKPRIDDCMVLQQATPTRFVCNGKIYTAVEPADIRTGNAPLAQL